MIIIKGTSLNKSKLWKSLAEKNYPLYKKKKTKTTKMSIVFYFPQFPVSRWSFPDRAKILPRLVDVDDDDDCALILMLLMPCAFPIPLPCFA